MTSIVKIQNLKKGEKFRFNGKVYTVRRKYISDDKPLVAEEYIRGMREKFHNEELSVEKL